MINEQYTYKKIKKTTGSFSPLHQTTTARGKRKKYFVPLLLVYFVTIFSSISARICSLTSKTWLEDGISNMRPQHEHTEETIIRKLHRQQNFHIHKATRQTGTQRVSEIKSALTQINWLWTVTQLVKDLGSSKFLSQSILINKRLKLSK